jgi:hypothetical protein
VAKQSGLGWTTLSVDDASPSLQDIRNDVTSFDFSTPRGVQEITGVDKSAIERLLLLADFSITLNGVFNPSANKSHAVLRTVPSTSVIRTVSLAIASQTLSCECLFSDYQLSRSDTGELTWTAPGSLADGAVPTWGP